MKLKVCYDHVFFKTGYNNVFNSPNTTVFRTNTGLDTNNTEQHNNNTIIDNETYLRSLCVVENAKY